MIACAYAAVVPAHHIPTENLGLVKYANGAVVPGLTHAQAVNQAHHLGAKFYDGHYGYGLPLVYHG